MIVHLITYENYQIYLQKIYLCGKYQIMIRSTEQAYNTIDTKAQGIPYEAIDHLRNLDSNEAIIKKLKHAFENAYNGKEYYSDELRIMLPAPLWYAVIAEKHLHMDYADDLLNLFSVEEDWDLMNEQAVYLVGQMAKKYPTEFVNKVLEYIEGNIDKESKTPYIFSFEALYYATDAQFNRIFAILDLENFQWLDHYIRILGDIQHEGTLEKFKAMLPKFEGKHTAIELQYYIDVMEGRINDFQKGVAFCEMRDAEWKNHYQHMEAIFSQSEAPIQTNKKVGRNDPCVCGSGKKFKQCCMN